MAEVWAQAKAATSWRRRWWRRVKVASTWAPSPTPDTMTATVTSLGLGVMGRKGTGPTRRKPVVRRMAPRRMTWRWGSEGDGENRVKEQSINSKKMQVRE